MSAKRARQQRLAAREQRQRRERLVFDGAADRGCVIPEAIWNARVRDRGGWIDTRPPVVAARPSFARDDLVSRVRRRIAAEV